MKTEFENEIWESVLKAAVIENSLREIEDYPSDDEISKIELPVHYTETMQRFIRRHQRKKRAKLIAKYLWKSAAVIFIIMGIGFSILLPFDEVRATCKTVITKLYERYVEFVYEPSDNIQDYVPEIGFIPNGFSITDQYSMDTEYTIIWTNKNDESIKLTCLKRKHSIQIDNEHYLISDIKVNDYAGKYFMSTDDDFDDLLIWDTENSYYILRANLSKDILLKIAENIN